MQESLFLVKLQASGRTENLVATVSNNNKRLMSVTLEYRRIKNCTQDVIQWNETETQLQKKSPSSYCCQFFLWFYIKVVFYLHDSADAVPFTVSSDRFTVLHINCNFLNYYNKYFEDDDGDDIYIYMYVYIYI